MQSIDCRFIHRIANILGNDDAGPAAGEDSSASGPPPTLHVAEMANLKEEAEEENDGDAAAA